MVKQLTLDAPLAVPQPSEILERIRVKNFICDPEAGHMVVNFKVVDADGKELRTYQRKYDSAGIATWLDAREDDILQRERTRLGASGTIG